VLSDAPMRICFHSYCIEFAHTLVFDSSSGRLRDSLLPPAPLQGRQRVEKRLQTRLPMPYASKWRFLMKTTPQKL